MADDKSAPGRAREARPKTVRLCVARIGDRYATPGISLGQEKTRQRTGVDRQTGEPAYRVTTKSKVLLAGSYREVDEITAAVLIKRGQCQVYDPEVHGELVNGDEVKYRATLDGQGPPRVSEDAEEEMLK